MNLDPFSETVTTYAENCAVIYSPRKPTQTLCQMPLKLSSPAQDGFAGYKDKMDKATMDAGAHRSGSSQCEDAQALRLELPRLGLRKPHGCTGMTPEGRTPEGKIQDSQGEKMNAQEGDSDFILPVQNIEPMPEPENDPSLEIVFDAKGEERRMQIFKRPLGAEFSKRRSGPTKVSYVDPQSYAEELGLEVGFVVRSIAGVDMGGKTFRETQDAIKVGLMALPVGPSKF